MPSLPRFLRTCFLLSLALLALGGLLTRPALAADAQAGSYANLKKQFEELKADSKKSWLRENWINLENDFTALGKKAKGATLVNSLYMKARSREELSARSFNQKDMEQAAEYYAEVARRFPKNSLADDCLYAQAYLLGVKLDKKQEALTVLADQLKRYPKGDFAGKAKALQAELETGAPAAGGADRPSSDSASKILEKITWKGNTRKATVILQLNSGVPYQYAYLPPDTAKKLPARVVIELPGMAKGSAVKDRHGPQNNLATRIITAKDGGGLKVTVNCAQLAMYAVSSPKPGLIHVEISRNNDISGGIRVLGKDAAAATGKNASDTLLEQLGLTVQTIMLDAGHGGKDPGARANGITEKQMALKMTKLLGEELKKRGFTILHTRESDVFIPLENRPLIANEKKADLFISVHCNANTKATISGLETYYLDEAKSSSASKVAARENAVSVKKVSDLQVILADLTLNAKLEESRDLASRVHKGMLTRLKVAGFTHNDNGSRSAPFYVLMGARMPAILVEVGYVTNATDAKRMKNDVFLQRLAEGIANGIAEYKSSLAQKAPGGKK